MVSLLLYATAGVLMTALAVAAQERKLQWKEAPHG
jgi:hypothetical protein